MGIGNFLLGDPGTQVWGSITSKCISYSVSICASKYRHKNALVRHGGSDIQKTTKRQQLSKMKVLCSNQSTGSHSQIVNFYPENELNKLGFNFASSSDLQQQMRTTKRRQRAGEEKFVAKIFFL